MGANAIARALILSIININHDGFDLGVSDCLVHHLCKLTIDENDLRLRMVQHIGQARCVQPCIQGIEHRAQSGHSKVTFDHFWRVRQHRRDGVAFLHAQGA